MQRPPFCTSVFDEDDIKLIKKFVYDINEVPFTLYEYALKPRVELVLKSDSLVPEVPKVTPIYKMKEADPKTISHLEQYISQSPAAEPGQDENDENAQNEA